MEDTSYAYIPSSAASNARSSLEGCVFTSNTDRSVFVCDGASRRRVDECVAERCRGAILGESSEEEEIVGESGADIVGIQKTCQRSQKGLLRLRESCHARRMGVSRGLHVERRTAPRVLPTVTRIYIQTTRLTWRKTTITRTSAY